MVDGRRLSWLWPSIPSGGISNDDVTFLPSPPPTGRFAVIMLPSPWERVCSSPTRGRSRRVPWRARTLPREESVLRCTSAVYLGRKMAAVSTPPLLLCTSSSVSSSPSYVSSWIGLSTALIK